MNSSNRYSQDELDHKYTKVLPEWVYLDGETLLYAKTRVRGHRHQRMIAGCEVRVRRSQRGYWIFTLYGTSYHYARAKFSLYYGRAPKVNMCIDHINGDINDNRITNLREVSHTQNMYNRRAYGKSIYAGVSKRRDNYCANVGASSEYRAALYVDLMKRLEHKEHARLNFPDKSLDDLIRELKGE